MINKESSSKKLSFSSPNDIIRLLAIASKKIIVCVQGIGYLIAISHFPTKNNFSI